MDNSYSDRLWSTICGFQRQLLFSVGLALVLLVFVAIGFATTEPGTASYVILQLDLVLLVLALAIGGYSLKKCSDRESYEQ